MLKKYVFLFLTVISIVACNKDSKTELNNESTEIKYNYTCNGCSTQDQVFSTKQDYCAGLLDESRNKSCCRNMREQIYAKECK